MSASPPTDSNVYFSNGLPYRIGSDGITQWLPVEIDGAGGRYFVYDGARVQISKPKRLGDHWGWKAYSWFLAVGSALNILGIFLGVNDSKVGLGAMTILFVIGVGSILGKHWARVCVVVQACLTLVIIIIGSFMAAFNK